jgi:magnesium-protoporphyrin O-methyltransferase
MTCCCSNFCGAAEQQFTQKKAAQELAQYRRKGPGPTTRLLQDGLIGTQALDGLLLDIGCGIGSLTFGLLEAGMARAVAVDASSAYVATAKEEAERRGVAAAVQFVHGDFMTVAPDVPPAAVVTLDRVVCCYPSFAVLLPEALRHAERCIALSYPRDVWFVRAGVVLENGGRRLTGHPFRTFVHSVRGMHDVIARAGFELVSRRETFAWAADVYIRRAAAPAVVRSAGQAQ